MRISNAHIHALKILTPLLVDYLEDYFYVCCLVSGVHSSAGTIVNHSAGTEISLPAQSHWPDLVIITGFEVSPPCDPTASIACGVRQAGVLGCMIRVVQWFGKCDRQDRVPVSYLHH